MKDEQTIAEGGLIRPPVPLHQLINIPSNERSNNFTTYSRLFLWKGCQRGFNPTFTTRYTRDVYRTHTHVEDVNINIEGKRREVGRWTKRLHYLITCLTRSTLINTEGLRHGFYSSSDDVSLRLIPSTEWLAAEYLPILSTYLDPLREVVRIYQWGRV
jgi:hypothetical protein